ncbi:protein CDV3 homolog isoform X2 [Octopus sinensis]|uniref:Protein CDV3 homolog isoform X2 n=1 Tax=Octopus sinensis TaxID=2607531 RepID=A0A7E6ES23_9MOLL|nr:protein CDV3 homolog isoform X2 [Octopus sinensis]
MADSSLDDFFAKKDRNKKKSKQKTAPSSEFIAQPDTATRKTKKKPEKEKQSSGNVAGTQPSEIVSPKEDLEWNDYEQETEKDYSGLRIQNLQLKSDDDDDDENELNQDNNENSESGERHDSSQGPWSKQGAQTPPAPSPTPAPETPEPVAAQETPKSVGRYIPPSQRGNSSSAASVTRTRLAKKTAPNIQSEVDFPTLGGGAPNDVEKKYIDRVRNNNRNYEDPSNHSLPLKLNNKFKVLED